MSTRVRQRKSPYFYARRGRTLVLMEHGVPTKQTFSSEAAAKRTVLEMNDAWRAQQSRKANPARTLRRNFLGLFGPKGPRFKVDEHRRDIRNKVEVVSETVGEEDLRWQLFTSGIRKAELDGAFAQAKSEAKTTFYNKHGDLVEVTRIEAKAKANPARKYDESRDGAGFRKLSDLKKGEYIKRKADARKVYRKGDYIRSEKKFACMDTDDISREIYLKGDTMVYVGFDY
jgi:hypothetical protein